MNQQQEDAVVGAVARERAEVEKHLAILEAELQRHREIFARLTERLGEVDYILFDNEQWPESMHAAAGWRMSEYRFSSEAINGDRLKTLCKEIKETKARRDRLEAQLKRLGL